jgi:hypothetical protein
MSPAAFLESAVRPPSRWAFRSLALLGALGLSAAACGEKIQETYRFEIIPPPDENVFADATTVILASGDNVLATTNVSGGRGFELKADGIQASATTTTSFRLWALNAAREVVAFGQTPEIELRVSSPPGIGIFVQKPGTIARAMRDLERPIVGHFAVTARAAPGPELPGGIPMRIPVFGTGEVRVAGVATTTTELTNALFAYKPLLLEDQVIGGTGTSPNVSPYRRDAAAETREDLVVVFGGATKVPGAMPGTTEDRVSAQLDVIPTRRIGFDAYAPGSIRTFQGLDGTHRSGAAMVKYQATFYAVGGRNDMGPLNSVVAIDLPDANTARIAVLEPTRLLAPRERHTATLASPMGAAALAEILVFGGTTAADVPVAEIFLPQAPAEPRTVPVSGDAGPPRRDHAAVSLPDNRVLILGGVGPDDKPLSSVLLYTPGARTVEAAPFSLQTPRSAFVAFLAGDDLVVAGGLNEAGAPIGNAEVYNAKTLAFVKTVTCRPRARAKATDLPNGSVVIIGGEGENRILSNWVDIYHPQAVPAPPRP